MEDGYEDDDDGGAERYLIVWDMYGLELAINMDGCVSKRVEAVLLGKEHKELDLDHLIQRSLLRARFNTHRNYEIYAIGMPAGTTEDDVVDMFERSPQSVADLIRKKGLKLHGSSSTVKPVIY